MDCGRSSCRITCFFHLLVFMCNPCCARALLQALQAIVPACNAPCKHYDCSYHVKLRPEMNALCAVNTQGKGA